MPEPGAKFRKNLGLVTETYNTTYSGLNYGAIRARETTESQGDYRKMVGDDEDSGVYSPPLWRTTSPLRSPQRSRNQDRNLSLSSRAQAIARGQKELMEMVSRMPEGCYELSLKDLVEQPMVGVEQETSVEEKSTANENVWGRGEEEQEKRKESKIVQLNRKGSMHDNGGHLLKMFPISWGSSKNKKKKKKKSSVSAISAAVKDGRVSPKPLLSEGSPISMGQDWWKNRCSDEGEESTESGGFSSNSRSSKSIGSASSSRSSSRNNSRYGLD